MVGYYPNARSEGIARMARVAAKEGSFLTTHPRYLSNIAPSGVLGQEEFIAIALAYDVPLLLHHVPTNALSETQAALDMIDAANANGATILGEAFPYVKGSTFMGTEILSPGWQERTGMDYSDLIWVETGETLTEETFNKYRAERPDGFFVMAHIKEKDMLAAVLHRDIIIASEDAVIGTPYSRMWGAYLTGMWIYRLGLAEAKWRALTGEPFTGREAADIGLIGHVTGKCYGGIVVAVGVAVDGDIIGRGECWRDVKIGRASCRERV